MTIIALGKKRGFQPEWLFAFLWVLIILPKAVTMVITVLMGIYLNFRIRNKSKSGIYLVLLLLGIIQLAAIAFSLTYLEFEAERYIAAVNTSFVWITAAPIFEIFRHATIDFKKIGKIGIVNILVMALLSVVAYLQFYKGAFSFLPQLYVEDWVNGARAFRLLCLMDYSNAIPIFVMLNLGPALLCLRKHKVWAVVIFAISAGIIYFSNSRISLAALALFVFMGVLHWIHKYHKRFFVPACLALFLAAVGLFAFGFDYIVERIGSVLMMREGSNSARMTIYMNGIDMALKHNPIFGVGVKVMIGDYPLGSHSSVVGAFYKTGIVGLILLISIPFLAIKNRSSARCLPAALALIALIPVFFFEDLDGMNWIALSFFALLGSGQKGPLKAFQKNRVLVLPNEGAL